VTNKRVKIAPRKDIQNKEIVNKTLKQTKINRDDPQAKTNLEVLMTCRKVRNTEDTIQMVEEDKEKEKVKQKNPHKD